MVFGWLKLKVSKLKIIFLTSFMLLAIMPIINNARICNAQAQVGNVGTHFEIKDSEYLNINLESSEEVKALLESIPKMISLNIESVSDSVDFTDLTLSGLEPDKTYYKYENSYKNLVVFNSGVDGIYSWAQEINQSQHIWIQETKSTIFIGEDTILDHDITGPVEITANNITLDCAGHRIISATSSNIGIYLNSKSGIKITNCIIDNFSLGINSHCSKNGSFTNNIISNSYAGIYLIMSQGNTITNNNVLNNNHGILSVVSNDNTIIDNDISDNEYGIRFNSNSNIISDNKILNNTKSGIYFQFSHDNIVTNNVISYNNQGVFIESANGNKIYHNNFINNDLQIDLSYSCCNIFDNGYPDGGNYWSDYNGVDLYNGSSQDILGSDGTGDAPYEFYSNGQDGYPFMEENGWEISEPVCGNNICEEGETFENCYQDCAEEGIEKYFPYYKFSYGEEYYPVSFYFDNDADVENNKENYETRTGDWEKPYVYVHTVEDDDYFTIQYWKYEAYNEHRASPLIRNHDHDWDATVFVVFKKNDFSQPTEVRFARHIYIGVYTWDEIEKRNTTHPVVYVAKGSHGGYHSQDMGSLDVFEDGGITYGLDIFNYYRVGYCSEVTKKEINGKEREFCLVKNKLLSEEAQNEPADAGGYWPNRFEGRFFHSNFFSPEAPWNPGKEKWNQTRPEGAWSALEFGVDCPVDLHIYDLQDRHVGINYETNEPEIEIPGAIFRQEGEKQYVMIPNPLKDYYRVKIVGTDNGEYDFAMVASEDMNLIETLEKKNIPIAKDEVQIFTVVGLQESPKEMKLKTVVDLESIENNNKTIQKNIQKVVDLINESLDEKYWIDGLLLDPKKGKKVFDYELKVITRLKILENLNKKLKLNDDQLLETIKMASKKLAEADYLLAETIFNETKEIETENNRFKKIIEKFIAKAEEELVEANEDLENDKFSKSIIHSKKSWHYTQQAIKLIEHFDK